MSDYPHLAPALGTLTGDALDLWGDAEKRHRALAAIVAAWEQGNEADLDVALRRVDDAVVAGLRALGLPRGPIKSLRFEAVGRRWRGRKLPECELVLDALEFIGATDSPWSTANLFRAWVHESLHARQPLALTYRSEADMAGYEEGLVAGLTHVVHVSAGIAITEASYTLYVAAYETLAETLGVPVEGLWRRLWMAAPGAVQVAFVDAVEQLRRSTMGRHLTVQQRNLLLGRANTVFATGRARELEIDREFLRSGWERVLR